MSCSGEEQEKLLSLLEQEEAKKRNSSRTLKDERNGGRLGLVIRPLSVREPVCLNVTLTSSQ